MNASEALKRISEIQKIAERTTVYSLLPGGAAILGGALALTAWAATSYASRSQDIFAILRLPVREQFMLLGMWIVLFAAAVVADIFMTSREAARRGLVIGRPGKLAASSLTPALIIALMLSIRIALDIEIPSAEFLIRYVPPIWMMCYGAGIYSAGLFSVRLPRIFGILFISCGAINLLCFPEWGMAAIALSFGMLHVLFGLIVLRRKDQNA